MIEYTHPDLRDEGKEKRFHRASGKLARALLIMLPDHTIESLSDDSVHGGQIIGEITYADARRAVTALETAGFTFEK